MNKNVELVNAVKKINIAQVKDLLDESKYLDMCADVNFQKIQNMTPLHFAVHTRSVDMVKVLIKRYAEVNTKNDDGRTPLHLACAFGHIDIVKELTKNSAEVFIDSRDVQGNTPLHLASQNGYSNIIRYLTEERGANCFILNTQGQKPREVG